jgi:hypothetical protein
MFIFVLKFNVTKSVFDCQDDVVATNSRILQVIVKKPFIVDDFRGIASSESERVQYYEPVLTPADAEKIPLADANIFLLSCLKPFQNHFFHIDSTFSFVW